MNSILMIIVAVIVILLVFIMFSLDDQEEVPAEDPSSPEPAGESSELHSQAPSSGDGPPPPATAPPTPAAITRTPPPVALDTPLTTETGSKKDLKFRTLINDQLPAPTACSRRNSVVVVPQIRYPEELHSDGALLVKVLAEAEQILSPEKAAFPFSSFASNQGDRLWLFGFDEDRDDAVFEAIVTAVDAVKRFKKALEGNQTLLGAKVRLSIGISTGEINRISRGPLGPVSHSGKAIYLAETLAEASGDFKIYVDQEIHRQSLPLFDFREWKPTKLREPLPPVPIYELVGWNKKEEIFAFTSHQEVYARRAVAVAFRYLDFDDISPLLNLLADPDERVTLETLDTIAEIGDDRVLGILKKILPEAKNSHIRSVIIHALGSIGREEILPVLLASTKDVNWQVRFQAVQALFSVCKKDADKHLQDLVRDEDGAVRAVVHKILYLNHPDPEHLQILGELMFDLSLRARKAAIEALIEIGEEPALLAVVNAFPEQENDLKRLILRLLMNSRSKNLYRIFLDLFEKSDERSRGDIVAAVRRANLMG